MAVRRAMHCAVRIPQSAFFNLKTLFARLRFPAKRDFHRVGTPRPWELSLP